MSVHAASGALHCDLPLAASEHNTDEWSLTAHGFWIRLPMELGGGTYDWFEAYGRTWGGHWDITLLFEDLLQRNCPDGLVVDVGMNAGFYTLLSASFGCEVLAFDLQDRYHFAVHDALHRNGLERRVCLRRSGIHEKALSQVACGGHGVGLHLLPESDGQAKTERLDTIFDEELEKEREVLLMKVDVEGFELSVLSSCFRALRERRVANLVVEIGDGAERWPRANKSMMDALQLLADISNAGYELRLLQMRRQPSAPYLFPRSPKFNPILADWQHANMTVGVTKHSAFVNAKPRGQIKTETGFPTARRTFKWIVAEDLGFLVSKLLWEVDFNIWFHRI